MKKFCIIVNLGKDGDLTEAGRVIEEIERLGGTAQLLPHREEGTLSGEGFTDLTVLEEGTEAAIVLGGDGTIIQAARELAEYGIPLLGINLGTLGFLAETELENKGEALARLVRDEFSLEERLMLCGTVYKDGKNCYEGRALNDIVVSRSGYSRIITAEVSVGGMPLNLYQGDGLIISTPTGSTAYNLSAGGPVILPSAQVCAITPICPHSIGLRSVVAAASDGIRIEVLQSKKSRQEEAIVSFDGNKGIELTTGDIVKIVRSDCMSRFIRLKHGGLLDSVKKIDAGPVEAVREADGNGKKEEPGG